MFTKRKTIDIISLYWAVFVILINLTTYLDIYNESKNKKGVLLWEKR